MSEQAKEVQSTTIERVPDGAIYKCSVARAKYPQVSIDGWHERVFEHHLEHDPGPTLGRFPDAHSRGPAVVLAPQPDTLVAQCRRCDALVIIQPKEPEPELDEGDA